MEVISFQLRKIFFETPEAEKHWRFFMGKI